MSDRTLPQWDGAAEWYDQNMGERGDPLNRELLRPLVLEMLGDLSGQTLLDCGCGSGYLTAELAGRARRVVATDFAPAFVSLCRRKYAGVVNLEFLEHDLAAPRPLPLADHSMDVVLCKMVLQYVAEIAPFAREARRVLRESGQALVVVDHPFHAQFHYAQRLAGVENPKYPDLAPYFDQSPRTKLSLWGKVQLTFYPRPVSAYVQAFAAAGLHLIEMRELPEPGAETQVPRVLVLRLGALRLERPAAGGRSPAPGPAR
ncbi:MAG TPA: class I SAM-dependent methyltransferase [Vicinamibacteria bacterium]